MKRLLITSAFIAFAAPALAEPLACFKPVIGKNGNVLYCTRDFRKMPDDQECGCRAVAIVEGSDPVTTRVIIVDPPIDPPPPPPPGDDDDDGSDDDDDPADDDDEPGDDDPIIVDPPKDPKPPKKPKDNKGGGNGDEGDCKGKGCVDPDNPGKGNK